MEAYLFKGRALTQMEVTPRSTQAWDLATMDLPTSRQGSNYIEAIKHLAIFNKAISFYVYD